MHTKPLPVLPPPRPHIKIPPKNQHALPPLRPLHKRPRLPRLRRPRELHRPRRAGLHVRAVHLQPAPGRPALHLHGDEADALGREAVHARNVRVPLPPGGDDRVPAEEEQARVDEPAHRPGRVVPVRVRGARQQGGLVREGLVQDDDVVGVQERGDGEGAGVRAPVWIWVEGQRSVCVAVNRLGG